MSAAPRLTLSGIRAAIIDLDGTLLHTAPDFHIAINRMRDELDLAPVGIEVIEGFVGKGTEYLVRQIIGLDYDEATVKERIAPALDSYHRHYHAINGDHVALYPDVKEGLEALRAKGLRLACVTNKPVGFAVPLLEKTGLAPWFELVYGGDSFARKKPDPYPLLQVCKKFGLEPQQVVAIGDSSNDAEAARAAGCRILTVPYGYNHGQSVHEIDSDGIVSTLLEAAHLISG